MGTKTIIYFFLFPRHQQICWQEVDQGLPERDDRTVDQVKLSLLGLFAGRENLIDRLVEVSKMGKSGKNVDRVLGPALA